MKIQIIEHKDINKINHKQNKDGVLVDRFIIDYCIDNYARIIANMTNALLIGDFN